MKKKLDIVAVAVIVNEAGNILLTQRNSPNSALHLKWQLPGGSKESGETLEQACVREAKEETGFSIKLESLSPHIIYHQIGDREFKLCGFRAKPISGTINVSLDQETNDARWLSRDEAARLDTLEQTVEMIDACLKHGRRTN